MIKNYSNNIPKIEVGDYYYNYNECIDIIGQLDLQSNYIYEINFRPIEYYGVHYQLNKKVQKKISTYISADHVLQNFYYF